MLVYWVLVIIVIIEFAYPFVDMHDAIHNPMKNSQWNFLMKQKQIWPMEIVAYSLQLLNLVWTSLKCFQLTAK